MNKFLSFIIKQSVAIILAVIFILGFGVYATLQMPINLLPDINVPMVCIQVIYPGANAQSVEKDVTAKLEEGLSSIGGVTSVDSYSYDNLSAVILSFDYGTDTGEKQSEISGKLSSLSLPDGITTDVYDIDLNAEALAVLSVTSGTEGEGGLSNAYASAKELAAKISAIDGVENVEIKGGPQKVWSVRPFGGLELLAPLMVQAFSYGALDLPLGNLTENGGEVQIRNNSDITSKEDILNMALSLPSSVVTIFSMLRQITDYYSNATPEEIESLADDLGSGVAPVLSRLDTMSADEADRISKLDTYMTIARLNVTELDYVMNSSVYSQLYDNCFNVNSAGEKTPKTYEELQTVADRINSNNPYLPIQITADLLFAVQQGKLDSVRQFRVWLESTQKYQNSTGIYSLDDEDCLKLAKDVVWEGETPPQDQELLQYVDFARKTSSSGLSAIAGKKREAEGEGQTYSPTDAECVRLFTGTEISVRHPILLSSSFMKFFRAPSYSKNIRLLIQKRTDYGSEIDIDEFYELYNLLDLDGVIEFRLSPELMAFILQPDRDFTNLTTDSDGNSVYAVKVRDVAKVRQESTYSSYVYFGDGGTPTIIKGTTIEIYKSNGANSSAVVENVKEVYSEYLNSTSAAELGTKIELLDDQSQFISDSIANVLVSMLIGGALAVIVILLFLKKIKTSLIIAVTMPLSVLAAIICMFAMGITLNMVSLGGLAVGIGMLVDNSIVVIENITVHRNRDKTPFRAAVDGTSEVCGALFGSTLTTVCVFIPIIFSGGLTGEIFTDLSWAVIFSLSLSLLVSITVIPALYAMFCNEKDMLKGGGLSPVLPGQVTIDEVMAETEVCDCGQTGGAAVDYGVQDAPAEEGETGKKKNPFAKIAGFFKQSRIMDGIINFYGRLLPAALGKKVIPIVAAIVVFGASIGMLFATGFEFLPSIDKGQIEVDMSYQAGVTLPEIEADVSDFARRIENALGDNLDYISVSVGKNGLLALTDTGIITVQLNTNRGTEDRVNLIRQLASDNPSAVAGRRVSVKQIDGVVASLMSGADDMSVTVLGDDGDRLKVIADDIMTELAKPENGFTDIKSTATEKSTQYVLNFNRNLLAQKGLDYQTIVLTLRIGIASYTACTATLSGEECEIAVSFDEKSVVTVDDLENLIIGYERDGDGNLSAIKIRDVVELNQDGHIAGEEVEACIRRSGGKQMISVSAALPGVDTGTAGDRMKEIAAEVLKKYDGYSFEQSGITSYLNDAFSGLAVALVISFFLLYAVMAVQFGSALKPLIIMSGIPFSFTGGFLALVITGTRLNVVSFIGLIMLMGVVVNNAIVMLEKIKQLHDEGMPHYNAVIEACKVRLRPIFMTTLTTILALIPLAIGIGQGSELMQPLGIVVIGGLLISTLVTLVLVPCIYCAVHRISEKYPEGRKKGDM